MEKLLVAGIISGVSLVATAATNIFLGKREAAKYGVPVKGMTIPTPVPQPQAAPAPQAQTPTAQSQQTSAPQVAPQATPAPQPQQTSTPQAQAPTVQPQQFLGYDATGNPIYGFQVAPAPQA